MMTHFYEIRIAGHLDAHWADWFDGMGVAKPNQNDLVIMKELLEAGKVKPVIDRCYPLSEVPDAIRYLEEGHAQGKVVITVAHNN